MPVVSIVVPFLGLTKYRFGILQGNPQKELQWRLWPGKGYFKAKAKVYTIGAHEPLNPKPYGALTGPSGPLVGTLIGYRPICIRDLVEAPYILP